MMREKSTDESSNNWPFMAEVRMGRRRRTGAKPPPQLIRYIDDKSRATTEVINSLWRPDTKARASTPRLCWRHYGGESSDIAAELAETICETENDEVHWICDSNFFIAPTDPRIWEVLLAKRGRLSFVKPLEDELKYWLNDPKSNFAIAEEVRNALQGSGTATITTLDFPREDKTQIAALVYYINLIGLRRHVGDIARSVFTEEFGSPPNNQDLSNYCKDKFGTRAQLIARKGADIKIASHKFNDEVMVVLAIANAIRTGRETAILTRDRDIFEQFYKALWLLDTHYRAMLLAQQYDNDPFAFHPANRITDEARQAFDGEVLLLRKPSHHLNELLPPLSLCRLVPIHCFLITHQVAQSTFMAERGMSHILDMKGKTQGLSTNLLGGRNCHVFLGPLAQKWGNLAAIGHDISVFPNDGGRISLIDANLSILDCEPVVHLREVPPQLIYIPKGDEQIRRGKFF